MLCTEGMVRATINLLEVVIRKNDFVIVLPNSFIQIHEVSSGYPYFFCRFLVRFYAFRQLCGNPAGLYAYDIEQSGHFSARGCCRLIPKCISFTDSLLIHSHIH